MLPSFVAVMRKEIRQTLRDRRMMVLLLVAPILQLFVFGSAANLDVNHVPTAVVDQDDTAVSRRHLARLFADGTLEVRLRSYSISDAEAALIAGQVSAAIVIPPGFSRALARGAAGAPARVQLLVDGSDPNRSAVASSTVARFFGLATVEAIRARRAALGTGVGLRDRRVPTVRTRVLYNPGLATAIYMVPGIAALLLLLVTTIVMSMGLARERESGTLEQILVTPVSPLVLLTAKMLPFAVIGLFDWTFAMVVGTYVFDVPLRGSFPLLLLLTTLYLITTLSVGLLISTISATQQQAFLGGFLFVMPAMLLSGIATPVRSMPEWLEALTVVNPVRHYADALRAILLRGAAFADVQRELAILFAFGVVLALSASLRFRKTVA